MSVANKFAVSSTRTQKVGTEARVAERFAAGKQGRIPESFRMHGPKTRLR